MGGTQRLAKLIGTAKAMELCLTGRMMDAAEAERSALVARVVELLAEALKTAGIVADMSVPATLLAKEVIHRADEIGLTEGPRSERRIFHYLFALEDQKEGRAAFVEKRKPEFKHM